MISKSVYAALVMAGLLASSCRTPDLVLKQPIQPTELFARIDDGKIIGSLEGEQLRSFARKLALKRTDPSDREQLSKAKLVDSHLELSGKFVYLIVSFKDEQTGGNTKVATSLESQSNSTYSVSL
ncbi:hypothetical protein [Spirosoma sp. KUDC1026]|uniref:hypothetical protein n=1 Tax=Spirosoma sp. KUDC1026 TaxID=2745947 RepID=UPI00159BE4D8|nr:hypothetical protein [Spirosoma sp. KUDC1026]QKZ11520.1 hypothetical protein HU175_02265 [Spirosoma sp. KUDC1026]